MGSCTPAPSLAKKMLVFCPDLDDGGPDQPRRLGERVGGGGMVLFLVELADLLGPHGLERVRYEFVNEAEKTYHVLLLAMHLECLLIDPLGMHEEAASI